VLPRYRSTPSTASRPREHPQRARKRVPLSAFLLHFRLAHGHPSAREQHRPPGSPTTAIYQWRQASLPSSFRSPLHSQRADLAYLLWPPQSRCPARQAPRRAAHHLAMQSRRANSNEAMHPLLVLNRLLLLNRLLPPNRLLPSNRLRLSNRLPSNRLLLSNRLLPSNRLPSNRLLSNRKRRPRRRPQTLRPTRPGQSCNPQRWLWRVHQRVVHRTRIRQMCTNANAGRRWTSCNLCWVTSKLTSRRRIAWMEAPQQRAERLRTRAPAKESPAVLVSC
jgi:hypothetical protein